jgi:hypothetical protein
LLVLWCRRLIRLSGRLLRLILLLRLLRVLLGLRTDAEAETERKRARCAHQPIRFLTNV